MDKDVKALVRWFLILLAVMYVSGGSELAWLFGVSTLLIGALYAGA